LSRASIDKKNKRKEKEKKKNNDLAVLPSHDRFDNKMGTTLASAHALCLNLLSCVQLHISEGWDC